MKSKLLDKESKDKVASILKRFKNPMVITSIISQILIILTIMKININADAITNIVVAVCSILVSLGIMNNPEKDKNSEKNAAKFGKKTLKIKCPNCDETTEYLMVDCELMTDDEGNLYEISSNELKKKDADGKPIDNDKK